MKKMNKVFKKVEDICMAICVALLVVIVISIFYQVIVRKAGFSVTWVDETSRYAMILLVFIGTIPIARQGSHIRILSFVDMLPKKVRKITEILTNVAALAVMIVFSYSCFYAGANVGPIRFSMLTFVTMQSFYYCVGVIAIVISISIIAHIGAIATGEITFGNDLKEKEK